MRPGHAASSVVLALTIVGCELGNPTVVIAPDGGARARDAAMDAPATDAGADAGARDAAGDDAVDATAETGVTTDLGADAEAADAGSGDADGADSGAADASPRDTGPLDTGPMDTGPMDTGPMDAGPMDTGPRDNGPMDTGAADAGVDVPVIADVGPPDAGPTLVTTATESCTLSGTAPIRGVGRYVMRGSTDGRSGNHRPSCANAPAPDVGYPVTLPVFSRLRWSARPTGSSGYAPVVYLTQSCLENGGSDARFRDEVACVSNAGAPALTRGGVVDLPPGGYYLVVDGVNDGRAPNSGDFEVTLDVSASENSPAYSVEPVTTRACTAVPPGATLLIDAGDDEVALAPALPFAFRFFGRATTRLAAYDNGFLTLLPDGATPWPAALSWRNHAIAFSGSPIGTVAPFWDDFVVTSGSGSNVFYWADGAAPGRVAHVAWVNVLFYRDRSTRVSFEAKLLEAGNVIEFAYCGETRNTPASRGAEATVGLESIDQTAARLVGLNAPATIAPDTGYRFRPR